MRTESGEELVPTFSYANLLETDPFFERLSELQEAIARRAYELFASNGFTDGRDLEHWLQAESKILQPAPLEVTETENGFRVRAEVPGFREGEIEVRAEPRRIYISGERKEEPEGKKGKTIYSEWGSNQISRWFELPAEIDPEKVKATLSDGVLELTLQRAPTARKIHVESKAA